MTIDEALDLIKATDYHLYAWIIANGRSISDQSVILYAKHIKENTE